MTHLEPMTIVITGPSAAGKSTVARPLAERFERGVHLEGDWFRRNIASGRADMTPNPSDEALRQLRLRYELSAASAESYRAARFGVIVEDVIAGTLLQEYMDLLVTPPIHLVVLMPSAATIREREEARRTTGYGSWSVGQLYDLFVRETPRIGQWIDSSVQTPDQTVETILETTAGESALTD